MCQRIVNIITNCPGPNKTARILLFEQEASARRLFSQGPRIFMGATGSSPGLGSSSCGRPDPGKTLRSERVGGRQTDKEWRKITFACRTRPEFRDESMALRGFAAACYTSIPRISTGMSISDVPRVSRSHTNCSK